MMRSTRQSAGTLNLENGIRSSGIYDVVSVWERENPEVSRKRLQREIVPYPHHIVYDFQAILEKRDLSLTSDLTIDCFHIPISIVINDSLTKDPIFIENKDPQILIKEFVKKLTRRQEIISEEVWKTYPMVEGESLPFRVQGRRINWVNQASHIWL